ncbi:MAG: integrase core domain-containing protein [Candidatus Electryonea clarkiae]|nr:integrase core domain-containing protein [Candidatus Electryonea clarkiae]MDP8289172.1 integrase core domain-containing protein [Candidatus Electryonea clarkiae]
MIEDCISDTREITNWSLTKVLNVLQVSRSSYYRYRKVIITGKPKPPDRFKHSDRILFRERAAIIAYACEHSEIRHRSLAWKMIDDNVAFVSPSTVYRILVEEYLICRWQPRAKRDKCIRYKGNYPDEKWQSDIRYVKIIRRTYDLIVFIDYIVHHELMLFMDGNSVSLAALDAFSTIADDIKPEIQTDNGSCYISHEFKLVLSEEGVGHHRIYPYCPEENGLVERVNRTLGEKIDEHEPSDFQEAKKEISNIIDWYNNERLHSSINFLIP